MTDIQMIDELDQKIAKLQAARDALAEAYGQGPAMSSPVRRGRPVMMKKVATKTGTRRQMSPEARAKIAEAQKRRWAGVAAGKEAVVARKAVAATKRAEKGGYRPRTKKATTPVTVEAPSADVAAAE